MTKQEYKRIRLILWQLAILINFGLLPFWTGFVFGPHWFKVLWLPSMIGSLLTGYWMDVTNKKFSKSE